MTLATVAFVLVCIAIFVSGLGFLLVPPPTPASKPIGWGLILLAAVTLLCVVLPVLR